MRGLFGSLLAIAVAGVAAIAATTALLNTPLRIGAETPVPTPPNSQSAKPSQPAAEPEGKPAADAGKPATPSSTDAAKPVSAGAKPGAAADKDDEGDKDPYEGIAPEDLPPDMQYNADSSVSFPTNI
jgi:predicted lipid-binding transport protein (Tim44 family)